MAEPENVELLDVRIKGKKKFHGRWHPNKPEITFYPETDYRLHPACFDPERFQLAGTTAPPPAADAPTPAPVPAPEAPALQSKELPTTPRGKGKKKERDAQ